MKLYFAGADNFLKYNLPIDRILISYYYYRDSDPLIFEYGKKIFCDCGAYSAWTKGEVIDVYSYGKFLLKYSDLFDVYVNLDVKGSLKKTLLNQSILEKEFGLKPVPVFHVKDANWSILERYIEMYDYICLGAIAGERHTKASLIRALDNVFVRARGKQVRFHGFGLTIEWVLRRYPFYSVDSTSWLSFIKYGEKNPKVSLFSKNVRERDHEKILQKSVRIYKKMEKEISDLWAIRGIIFKD